MSRILGVTVMVLGAVVVLLLGGAFPLAGAPELYRGGAMVLCGLAAALLCAWAVWRMTSGARLAFVLGGLSLFFVLAGFMATREFGLMAIEYARLGGPMWFGAIGMGCVATVGVLFVGIFGYFAWKLLTRRLWLAVIHLCLISMSVGVAWDWAAEERAFAAVTAGKDPVITSALREDGSRVELPFSLLVKKFDVQYYGEPTYALCEMTSQGPVVCEELTAEDSRVQACAKELEQRSYATVRTEQGTRVLLPRQRTVRDYRALCELTSTHRKREEKREVSLRVNEPIACKGWHVYLMSHKPLAGEQLVYLQFRQAPGRLFVLFGMAALIISTACWCWKRPEPAPATTED